MEQRSQILKQMHLTKNEREREVRLPWLGSESQAAASSGAAQVWDGPLLAAGPGALDGAGAARLAAGTAASWHLFPSSKGACCSCLSPASQPGFRGALARVTDLPLSM